MDSTQKLELLKEVETLQVIKDIKSESFGGIMFTVGSLAKYDKKDLQEAKQKLDIIGDDNLNGVLKGIKNFINEEMGL